MCSSTFRVNSTGYTPLGLIFRGTGDRGRGTVGTTTGKRHDIKHIGLHWIHTFRVQGTGDCGQGTVGTTTGKRHDIKHIGYYRVQGTVGTTRDTTSNTLDSVGYTLDISFY